MNTGDTIRLIGAAIKPSVGQVHGFVKGRDEGLLLVIDGQQFVVTVQRREKYEGPLPRHKRGFTLYELGDHDSKNTPSGA